MFFGKIELRKIRGVFPALERDERLDLIQQLQQNAQANIDFITNKPTNSPSVKPIMIWVEREMPFLFFIVSFMVSYECFDMVDFISKTIDG
jgi:hypothetical protein